MPDLSVFRDVEELDNRYIDKCIVYVEGIDDRNMWERLVGSDFFDRLEFKLPIAEGTGSETVLNRVSVERSSNPKVFGLVDGEVAAQFGEVNSLINTSNVLFELTVQRCEGILFLGAHELENILLAHSNIAEFIVNNVELKKLGSRNIKEVEHHLTRQARRFYVAALIKYTWAHMYFHQLSTGIGNIDHFRSDHSLVKEVRNTKQKIELSFLDGGKEFRRELVEIAKVVKKHMDEVKMAGGNIDTEIIRLADGKGLLIKLRNRWGFTSANEGLLVERIHSTEFATKFRTQLIAMTGA